MFSACVRDTDYPVLTAGELAASGQALFGPGWRGALAHALAVSEADIVAVESGKRAAPADWRARLIALAQDMALRALDTANSLLWQDRPEEPAPTQIYAPRMS